MRALFRVLSRAVHAMAIVMASAAFALLLLEVGIRTFLRVTDDIDYESLPGVGMRLVPGQEGWFIRDGVHAHFHVNAAGFNNAHEYATERPPGVKRVAVVGDSFIEAFHVDQGDALFDVMERRLNADGVPSEVYSFGISGFGTAQIYHLVNDYVLPYAPDAIVYLFVVNDVSDSARCADDHVWMQQYDVAPDGSLVQLPFPPYRMSPIKRVLRYSRLFQYVVYERRLLEHWRPGNWQATAIASRNEALDPCTEKAWTIVETLLVRLDQTLKARGIPWMIVWQGDSDPTFGEGIRTRLEAVARRHRLPYFDMSPAFVADFAAHGRPYRIPGDGHWLADGHRVVGTALTPVVERMLDER